MPIELKNTLPYYDKEIKRVQFLKEVCYMFINQINHMSQSFKGVYVSSYTPNLDLSPTNYVKVDFTDKDKKQVSDIIGIKPNVKSKKLSIAFLLNNEHGGSMQILPEDKDITSKQFLDAYRKTGKENKNTFTKLCTVMEKIEPYIYDWTENSDKAVKLVKNFFKVA